MDRAAAVGVTRAVTVADDLPSARWVTAAATWDERVMAAVALHPTRTAALTDDDLAEIERLAAHPRVVAVGETGLDYYWDYSPPAAQQRAFRWHIGLAKRLGKPLMIHDRDAHADILRILAEEGPPATVVFHCFSGDAAMARECVDAGFVLSFAGPVTFRNAPALRAAAAARAGRPAARRDRRPVPDPPPAPWAGQRALLPAVDGPCAGGAPERVR